jgi:hypothetical protein
MAWVLRFHQEPIFGGAAKPRHQKSVLDFTARLLPFFEFQNLIPIL